MPTSQDPKNPKLIDEEPSFHSHILSGIDPREEAALLRESRRWYKKQYGGSDADLDEVFGIRSRDSGYASGGKVKASKEKANYRLGTKKEFCGICTMFRRPSSCTAVEGKIRAKDNCDYFESKYKAKK